MSVPMAVGSDPGLDAAQVQHIARNVRDYIPSSADAKSLSDLRGLLGDCLRTGSDAGQSAMLRMATWNLLCALIDQISISSISPLRNILWEDEIWLRAFNLYIEQAPFAKPKPSRQLLTTLTGALSKNVDRADEYRSVLEIALNRQVELLVNAANPGQVKSAASALSHFLSRDIVSINQLLRTCEPVFASHSYAPKLTPLEYFLCILFRWLHKGDFGSTVSHVVASILDRADREGEQAANPAKLPLWVVPLEETMLLGQTEIDDLRVHLLPVLFKRNVADYATLLKRLGLEVSSEPSATFQPRSDNHELLFASLQAGKELGLLTETELDALTITKEAVLLPLKTISSFFHLNSRPARLTALSLLVNSPAATKPIHPVAIQLIKRNLSQLFADTDANFRGEVFGLFQRLVDRLRASSAVLARTQHAPTKDTKKSADQLEGNRSFLRWLLSALAWELRPTASYQRHISALKSLSILLRSGLDHRVERGSLSKSAQGQVKWPFSMTLVSQSVRRLLLDLLADPFEDVRQTAAGILSITPLDGAISPSSYTEMLESVLARAEANMLATGRADQADGVAHIYALLNRESGKLTGHETPNMNVQNEVASRLLAQLEATLHIARNKLAEAVEKYPVHGLLTSLRLVLGQSPEMFAQEDPIVHQLVRCLFDLWEVVKPILCDDAPEGYLPESMEEAGSVSTKDTLSFCWRALKEASLLIGAIVTWTPQSFNAALPVAELETNRTLSLSELCFRQLAELRHRGAFSTVAQTWTVCCSSAHGLRIDGIPALEHWYSRVIAMLRNNTTINTRRSAGLPSLICGILVAAKDDIIFASAFSDLETIARQPVPASTAQESSLAQVHAMNCLKDIFKNTRLGEASERYISNALRLAADALQSEAWAVRNCGLMLFRGVIDRLFGTSEAYLEQEGLSQRTVTEEQCPGLLAVVLDLLSTPETLTRRSEGVFPGLQLLQRLQVPELKLEVTMDKVAALTRSSVWHVRDKAARTFASFITLQNAEQSLRRMLMTGIQSQNALHGALLSARYLIAQDRLLGAPESRRSRGLSYLGILQTASHLYHSNSSPLTRAAYVDAIYEAVKLSVLTSEAALDIDEFDTVALQFAVDLEHTLQPQLNIQFLAAPRLALARVLALSCSVASFGVNLPSLHPLVRQLASVDSDACVEFLKVVGDFSCNPEFVQRAKTSEGISLCLDLLNTEHTTPAVKAAAQRLALQLWNETSSTQTLAQTSLDQPWATTTQLIPNGDQIQYDLTLQLRGRYIESTCHPESDFSSSSIAEITSWVRDCVSGMNEQGHYTRDAVSLALSQLNQAWKALASQAALEASFCELCLVLYDLLNDDDEDIRLRASATATHVLSSQGSSDPHTADLVPLIASEQLIQLLTQCHPGSQILVEAVLSRAFGQPPAHPASALARPFEAQFARCSDTDTALFAEEKQNLYVDEAREIRLWSLAARALDAHAFPRASLDALRVWVAQGLETLGRQARAQRDGSLGWTSEASVFALGLQLIYAVDFLLRSRAAGSSESTEQGVDAVAQDQQARGPYPVLETETLRSGLVRLFEASCEGDVNVLWLREMDDLMPRRGLDDKYGLLFNGLESFATSSGISSS